MGSGGEDYSNVAPGGQVNVTHPMHASQHEDGGSDEISVEGLEGVLAEKQDADKIQAVNVSAVTPIDAQVMIYDGTDEQWEPTDHPAPNAHKTSHQNEGTDEIDVAGLSGELADDQPLKAHDLAGAKHNAATIAALNAKISDATLDDASAARTPSAHKTSHQNNGTDEISVAGLAGDLADKQDADKLQGRTLVNTAPSDGQAVVWDAGNSQWEPGTITPGAKFSVILNPEAAIFPASSFPVLYKVDGTNFSHYEARFDADADEWLFFKVPIPASYTQGNLKVILYWKAAATSGNVVWSLSHYDRAAGEVLDTTATETDAVTDTVEGTTEYISTCSVTFSTNPADNDLMMLKVMRDGDNGSDTMSGDAKLLAVLIEEQ